MLAALCDPWHGIKEFAVMLGCCASMVERLVA